MSSDKDIKESHCLFCSLLCPIGVEFHERDVAFPFYKQEDGRACSRGSLSAELLYHRDRLNVAYIGRGDERKTASTAEAISHTAQRLKALGQEVAVVVDGNLPCETILKAVHFARNVLKTENVAVYLPHSDRGILEGLFASGADLFAEEDLLDCNALLALGDPFASHPPISKAVHDFRFKDRANRFLVADSYRGKTAEFTVDFYGLPPEGEDAFLAQVAQGLASDEDKALLEALPEVGVEVAAEAAGACQETLTQAGKVALLVTLGWAKNPRAEKIGALAGMIARQKGGVLPLLLYGNAQGAYRLAQNLKVRSLGALLSEIQEGKIKGLLSVGIDLATRLPEHLSQSLEGLEFLAQTASFNEENLPTADVVIPMALYLEESGTVLDGSGRKRRLETLLAPPKGALASGDIFDGLAQELGGGSLEAEITEELLRIPATKPLKEILSETYHREEREGTHTLICEPSGIHFIEGSLTRRLRWPSAMEPRALVHMNSQDSQGLSLRVGDEVMVKSGDMEVVLPVEPSKRYAQGVVGLSAPFVEAQRLLSSWIDEAGCIRVAPARVNLTKAREAQVAGPGRP